MFKIAVKKVANFYKMNYRTLLNYSKAKDYKKEILECFSDLIVLKDVTQAELNNFRAEELECIKNSIKKYLTDEISNEKLLELIKDNEIIKELVKKELEVEKINYKNIFSKIDLYLDKMNKYFLIKEILDEVEVI
jgi:hypothetical protein